MTTQRWYDDALLDHVWDSPESTYLAELQAQNLALAARRRSEEERDERRANTCPVCAGSGTDVVLHGYARDWETGEYLDAEEVACDSCDGGLLDEPLMVIDAAGCDAWLASYDRAAYDETTEVAS